MSTVRRLGAALGLVVVVWLVAYGFIDLIGSGALQAGGGILRSILAAGPWLLLGAAAVAVARVPDPMTVLVAGVALVVVVGLALAGTTLPLLDAGAQRAVARASHTWVVVGVLLAQGYLRVR